LQELGEESAVMDRERPKVLEGRIPEAWIGQEVMLVPMLLRVKLYAGGMYHQAHAA
jgi:hypothetical protein